MLLKLFKKLRKITAIVIAFTLMSTVLYNIPVIATGDSKLTDEYSYDDYSILYEINEHWHDSYKVTVTITNNSEIEKVGWSLKFDTAMDIKNIWNASVFETNDDFTIITNALYNDRISSNASISFSYIAYGNISTPDNIEMCQLRIKSQKDIETNFHIINQYENYFTGKIEIYNKSDTAINNWQLAIGSSFKMIHTFNFEIFSNEFDYLILEGRYNSSIPADSKIELYFTGENTDPNINVDYISEIVPYYNVNKHDLSQYYNVNNYINDEFPLEMLIDIDVNTLDFDMYGMEIMGIPYWNTENLGFDISLNINPLLSDAEDFEFILCNDDSQISYSKNVTLTNLSVGSTYDYNINIFNKDKSKDMYAGTLVVCTDVYNQIYILNDYSKVEPPKESSTISLMSAYINMSDVDYADSLSTLYNNESMSGAYRMLYNLTNRTSVSGSGIIRNAYDADYYAITVPANSKTMATLFVPSGKNYYLYILDSSGVVLGSRTAAGNKTMSISNNTSNNVTYYVLICGAGWYTSGSSTQYSASSKYSLNICNAKNSKVWFGQREYKVGTYEFWDGTKAKSLIFDNTKITEGLTGNNYTYTTNVPFFTAGNWNKIKSNFDIMEEGCVISCIAMSLRNLNKTMVGYDFRTYYQGDLPADPLTAMMANTGIKGNEIKYSDTDKKYHYSKYVFEPVLANYTNISNAFDATISKISISSLSEVQKAEKLMYELNNGSASQGIIIYSGGHAMLLFKSATPSASNYSDRFIVYDPLSSNSGVKYSTYSSFVLKNIQWYLTVK